MYYLALHTAMSSLQPLLCGLKGVPVINTIMESCVSSSWTRVEDELSSVWLPRYTRIGNVTISVVRAWIAMHKFCDEIHGRNIHLYWGLLSVLTDALHKSVECIWTYIRIVSYFRILGSILHHDFVISFKGKSIKGLCARSLFGKLLHIHPQRIFIHRSNKASLKHWCMVEFSCSSIIDAYNHVTRVPCIYHHVHTYMEGIVGEMSKRIWFSLIPLVSSPITPRRTSIGTAMRRKIVI